MFGKSGMIERLGLCFCKFYCLALISILTQIFVHIRVVLFIRKTFFMLSDKICNGSLIFLS